MKQFTGFPSKMDYAAVPAAFFSGLLPQITDIAELKTTLHIFRLILKKKLYQFVTFRELASDAGLVMSLRSCGKPVDETLRSALEMATARGTLLHLELNGGEAPEDVYFLNTPRDRDTLEKIRNGEVHLPGLKARDIIPEPVTAVEPNIFALYEQNIGLLTPMIAEALQEAEKLYPQPWIYDAFQTAVKANKRNWRYILRLLERWATEGKTDGTHQRDYKTTDPDKFIKGKYGHLFQR